MTDKPKLTRTFRFFKETAGTWVYKQVVDDPKRPGTSYYLPKADVALLGNPGSLVITIEAGD